MQSFDKAPLAYELLDYTNHYKPIMQFNKNKTAPVHQWYSFVEGYSKEFITSIIDELDYEPHNALDPFAGSGTTPVELQELGISCQSFEVSPFMHLLATVKLWKNYSSSDFTQALGIVIRYLRHPKSDIRTIEPLPAAQTFYKQGNLKKWIFNDEVIDGILDIKYAIRQIAHPTYRNLFKIALASILLDVSNVYRNGKCLAYKNNWQQLNLFQRFEVHNIFLQKITQVIEPDIQLLEQKDKQIITNNYELCYVGDVRKLLPNLKDSTIDLLITSPPYLNSRDYTDIYIVELWMLDLINNYDSLRQLRFETLRSHVQVPMSNIDIPNIKELRDVINQLNSNKQEHWNVHLIGMICGYFEDMDTLFMLLKKKMKTGSKLYFNVANSAYYGVEIKVDEIVASIAHKRGFSVSEIREARQLKPSAKQKDKISSLRESVIVMTA